MELLLKAHRPELYGERVRSEIAGAGRGAIAVQAPTMIDHESEILTEILEAELARREAERSKK
jgi:hypothetical protein